MCNYSPVKIDPLVLKSDVIENSGTLYWDQNLLSSQTIIPFLMLRVVHWVHHELGCLASYSS